MAINILPEPIEHKVATYNYLSGFVTTVNETNGLSYVNVLVSETGNVFTIKSLFGEDNDEITIKTQSGTNVITGSSTQYTLNVPLNQTSVTEVITVTVKHGGVTYSEYQAELNVKAYGAPQRRYSGSTRCLNFTELPLQPSTSDVSDSFSCSQCVTKFKVTSGDTIANCITYNTQDEFVICDIDTGEPIYPTISGITGHIVTRRSETGYVITVSASTASGDEYDFAYTCFVGKGTNIRYGWDAFYPIDVSSDEMKESATTFCEECGGSGDDESNKVCVKQSDIITSRFTRYGTATVPGVIINGYSVGDGSQGYASNQLVLEQDIDYNTISYDLIVKSITVEIDAMVDRAEYTGGYLPNYSGSQEFTLIPYAEVYNVKGETEEIQTSFDVKTTGNTWISDNSDSTTRTYSNVQISKSGFVAKVRSGSTLTINYFNDDKTLTSTTLEFNGSPVTSSITTSQNADSRTVTVKIDKNGFLTFGVAQWQETYGYFDPEVYMQNSSGFAVIETSEDEHGIFAGNIRQSAVSEHFNGAAGNRSINGYSDVEYVSSGWIDDAGDNFGTNAISNGGKVVSGDSVYASILSGEGLSSDSDSKLCGQDVYNTNSTVYYRGCDVNGKHMAYANDAYGNTGNTGFKGTLHLYTNEGWLYPELQKPRCTEDYPNYTCDEFISDYKYTVTYRRTYEKEMHCYGLTSILRRFRKIGDDVLDSRRRSYSSSNHAVSGDTFPKHIKNRSVVWDVSDGFNTVNNIRAGQSNVTGWTTVFETSASTETHAYGYNKPTVRNVVVQQRTGNTYEVSGAANTKESVKYYDIAPFFYMVDPENCTYGETPMDGFSYNFKTPSEIVDTTNTEGKSSTGETRHYSLKANEYLTGEHYAAVSSQDANRSYIAFIDDDGSTRTNRFGTTVTGSCGVFAPVEEVKWIDVYAPKDNSNVLRHAIVLFKNEFVDSGITEPTGERMIPMSTLDEWEKFSGSNITLSDINYPISTSGTYDYSNTSYDISKMRFTGDNNYKLNHTNQSQTSDIIDSLHFPMVYPYNGTSMKLGARTSTGSPTYNGAQNSIALNDQNEITAHTYYKADGKMISDTGKHDNHKFVDVYSPYGGDVYLRPCYGDVTIPVWSAIIKYRINDLSYQANSNCGLRIKVNGSEITTGGTNIGGANFYCVEKIGNWISGLGVSSSVFIMPIYEAGNSGSTSNHFNFNNWFHSNQRNGVYTIEVLAYNYAGDFKLTIDLLSNYNDSGSVTHSLSWEINGRGDRAVGLGNTLDLNKWNGYEDNRDKSLIVSTATSLNYISTMRHIYNTVGPNSSSSFGFQVFVNTTEKAKDSNNKGPNHTMWW